jgi:hypothetical protein
MLTLPLVLPTARAEAGLDVRVQLQLEGKDVTVAHGNDVVQFLPITEGPDGRKPDEVTCLVKDGCEVPLGTYTIDLDAKDFIVETRPELMVEPGGPKPIDVSLSVTPRLMSRCQVCRSAGCFRRSTNGLLSCVRSP